MNAISGRVSKVNCFNLYEIGIIIDGLHELIKTQQETSDPNLAWRMARAGQILARLEGDLNK